MLQVEVAQVFDSAQSLVERRAVDDEEVCGRLGIAGTVEKLLGRSSEFDVSVQNPDAWVDPVGVRRRNRRQSAVGADVVP